MDLRKQGTRLAAGLGILAAVAGCGKLGTAEYVSTDEQDLAQRVQILEQQVADLELNVSQLQGGQAATGAMAGEAASAAGGSNATNASAGNQQPVVATVAGTPGYLNVRREPSLSAVKIGALTEGAPVTVLGTQGEWTKIDFNHGQLTGWVASQFLKVQASGNQAQGSAPEGSAANAGAGQGNAADAAAGAESPAQ